MRIESLERILRTATVKSISKAAELLYMQQTTLSAEIRKVEEEVGFKIFNREHNGVTLTEKGIEFEKIATQMVSLFYEMQTIKKYDHRKFNIYVNSSLYSLFCEEIFNDVYSHLPMINLHRITPMTFLKHRNSKITSHQIAIDFCLDKQRKVFLKEAMDRDLTVIPLTESHLMLYMHKDNPLSHISELSLSQIADKPLIFGQYTKKMIDDHALRSFHTYSIMENIGPRQILNVVSAKNIIGILPNHQTFPSTLMASFKDVCPVKIVDEENTKFTQYLIYHKACVFTDDEKKIIDTVVSHFSD